MKRTSARQLLVTLVPALVVLAAISVLRLVFDVPLFTMTGDVNAIARIHPLAGFLSSLGALVWCVTASVCLFAATILRRTELRSTFWFLLSSGLLSAYLLLDDLFQFHEDLADRYFGLPEEAIIAALGTALVVYFITFRHDIGRTDFGILLLAVGFFAASVFIDDFLEGAVPNGYGVDFLEDGAKWLGIVCWCSYFARTSYQLVVGASRHPTSNAGPQPDSLL